MINCKFALTVYRRSGDVLTAYFYSMSQALSFVDILPYYDLKGLSISEWSSSEDQDLKGKEVSDATD